MTRKDKLEIGLKKDASYRKDNLPADQVRGPEIPAGPGRSADVPCAAEDKNVVPAAGDADDAAQVSQAPTARGIPVPAKGLPVMLA